MAVEVEFERRSEIFRLEYATKWLDLEAMVRIVCIDDDNRFNVTLSLVLTCCFPLFSIWFSVRNYGFSFIEMLGVTMNNVIGSCFLLYGDVNCNFVFLFIHV